MKTKHLLAMAFTAAATLLSPLPALAISVTDFEKLDAKGQTNAYLNIVHNYTAKAYQINIQTGDAVTDYFATIPPGESLPLGYTAFDARLSEILHGPKSNLDKDQIEEIIGYCIKVDVLDKLAKQTPATAPKTKLSN